MSVVGGVCSRPEAVAFLHLVSVSFCVFFFFPRACVRVVWMKCG